MPGNEVCTKFDAIYTWESWTLANPTRIELLVHACQYLLLSGVLSLSLSLSKAILKILSVFHPPPHTCAHVGTLWERQEGRVQSSRWWGWPGGDLLQPRARGLADKGGRQVQVQASPMVHPQGGDALLLQTSQCESMLGVRSYTIVAVISNSYVDIYHNIAGKFGSFAVYLCNCQIKSINFRTSQYSHSYPYQTTKFHKSANIFAMVIFV